MNRRLFLRGLFGVLGASLVGKVAVAADPRKVPGGVIMPDMADAGHKARMACLSNTRLADMIRKFNIRQGHGDNRVERFQKYRGLIRAYPEQYAYVVGKGWCDRNSEVQLQKLWDREWDKYGPPEVV